MFHILSRFPFFVAQSLNPNGFANAKIRPKTGLKGHKSLIFAGNVLYFYNSLAEPVSPLNGPYGFP